MRLTSVILLFFLGYNYSNAQASSTPTNPKWNEADRQYLLENLKEVREALLKETQNLTEAQWNFQPDSTQWSINQIIEHIAIWELIFVNEISVSLQMGPIPNFKYTQKDSSFIGQGTQNLKKEKAEDFTKPFTYANPRGENPGERNLNWLLRMIDETLSFVDIEERDLRSYYINFGPNIHQKCIMMFSHANRHIRQIQRVKEHDSFP